MTDITMCKGNNCPIKENCYRYLATQNKIHQSFFVKEPYNKETCEYYWENNKKLDRSR